MKMKTMDVLRRKMARHPRREIAGRSFGGTQCLELMTMDGTRPVMLKTDGYAVVTDGQGGLVLGHRATLAVETGRDYWTEPLVTDHLCHTRNCVNSAHLEWTTNVVNSSVERTSPEGLEVKRANGRAVGRARSEVTRVAVVSKHLDTGACRYHRDQLAAARELGLRVGNVSLVVHGKLRRTGRYSFERYDPTNPAHAALAKAPENTP